MATHEDALLMVQLLRWSSEMGADQAVHTVCADGSDAERASADDPPIAKLLTFGEAVGTLVKNGLLDGALVHDMWAVAALWARLGPAARRERERLGEPRTYENLEALAGSSPTSA